MDDELLDAMSALPAHLQVRALARACRAAGIEHEHVVQGDYEKIDVGLSMEDLANNGEFMAVFAQEITNAVMDQHLEAMVDKGDLEKAGIDEDGLVRYKMASAGMLHLHRARETIGSWGTENRPSESEIRETVKHLNLGSYE